MSDKYILIDRKAVPATTDEWARFFENMDARTVAKSAVNGANVSTVFLGLDHRFGDEGPPLIFETMIFGGPYDQYQDRCSTWEEAEEMHRIACVLAEAGHEP
jgi:hypothetical protein